ncbi:Coq4-domain-containing protein [Metschnikowia bicuspidata var. bicuspidata NRRL YB-4993]|uniref:4-hydroxy-3-methoxy-5-polyprenylbenzoate decarboxylase n=1 Tax=Metschnikowia bicuspidata var. bicuspidata NRRL YB-4993 TaxID=869754 RepID=A0A1A0HCA4_9ASCO|nr:Coq4-domain-containing protein [Metschnikowia bicuspidata var. bicuspidata NRRL YB-4993]OBA21625.1 Coq4-domain-containing protein [Metschnikowia bicuspidata var. bicuspidata NRRL YB-4993]
MSPRKPAAADRPGPPGPAERPPAAATPSSSAPAQASSTPVQAPAAAPQSSAAGRRRSNSQSQGTGAAQFGPPEPPHAGRRQAGPAARKKPHKRPAAEFYVTLSLLNDTFAPKHVHVPYFPDTCKLGRPTGSKVKPLAANGYFDSRVLSRNHACMYVDAALGQLMVQDMGLSNGTFVNLEKLGAEPVCVRAGDTINLGFNIQVETSHKQISARVDRVDVVAATPQGAVLGVLPRLTRLAMALFSDADMHHYEFLQDLCARLAPPQGPGPAGFLPDACAGGPLAAGPDHRGAPLDARPPPGDAAPPAVKAFDHGMFSDIVPSLDDLFDSSARQRADGAAPRRVSGVYTAPELLSTLDFLGANLAKVRQQRSVLASLEAFFARYAARVDEITSLNAREQARVRELELAAKQLLEREAAARQLRDTEAQLAAQVRRVGSLEAQLAQLAAAGSGGKSHVGVSAKSIGPSTSGHRETGASTLGHLEIGPSTSGNLETGASTSGHLESGASTMRNLETGPSTSGNTASRNMQMAAKSARPNADAPPQSPARPPLASAGTRNHFVASLLESKPARRLPPPAGRGASDIGPAPPSRDACASGAEPAETPAPSAQPRQLVPSTLVACAGYVHRALLPYHTQGVVLLSHWRFRALSGRTPSCPFVPRRILRENHRASRAMLSRSFLPRSLVQKRPFVLGTLATLVGSVLFTENNRLASKMERGELHYENPNVALNKSKGEPAGNKYFRRRLPDYPGHVPLYNIEKLLMFAGSGVGSYFHPERNENIVALGESTAIRPVLKRLQRQMLSDPVGREILRERPRITSTSLDLLHLRSLPDNTIGKTYVKWLDREGVSPDTRVAVRYIDDDELAYIYQRYRECHDFYHTITGLPIIIEGEIAVKVLEFMNMGILMPGLGALAAPFRLKKAQRERLYNIYYPWAFKSGLNSKPLINVYWEKLLENDIDEFRENIGIEQPPDLRMMRKDYFAKLKEQNRI